jgi:hypothetical protein
VIENKPGGGGGIGVDMVAKSAPDGQTLGIAAVAMHAINPWLFAKLPYDPIKDFAPITQMVRIPNVLVMNADTARRLNIKTLKDFLAYAKANPAKLNYGSGGNGSAGHLGGEIFKSTRRLLRGAHPLRRRRAVAAGAAGRPGRLHAGQPGHRRRQHPRRQDRAAGGDHPAAQPLLPDVPPMADTLPGLRDRHLVGPDRAGRHAARNREQAECRVRRPRWNRPT